MPAARKNSSSKKTIAATAQTAKPGSGQETDAVSLLKSDHRKVEQLFAKYESAGSNDEKRRIADEVCRELVVHSMIEEQIFYPACRKKADDEEELDEAQVEHDSIKLLVSELMREEPGEEFYDAKVKVLSEYVKHHVSEEEKPVSGIFAEAQKKGVDMSALGRQLLERKQQLLSKAQQDSLPPPRPRSLHPQPMQQTQETRGMNRQRTPERDEEGRFASDDERGYRGSSRGGYSPRSRYEDDDYDDRRSSRGRGHGGWYGDAEGHSQAARSRGDSPRSRYEDDDDYRSSSRGRGHGGWFGDPEGHSEASERGWEERSGTRSRSRYEDDDDGYRSSRGSSGRGRSHGGWFGDPEGHSEAAERGWEERSGSRARSRSRDDDDDDYRSSRSSSGRGRGHGGWFGDPEGHSEAAERGWEDRGRRR